MTLSWLSKEPNYSSLDCVLRLLLRKCESAFESSIRSCEQVQVIAEDYKLTYEKVAGELHFFHNCSWQNFSAVRKMSASVTAQEVWKVLPHCTDTYKLRYLSIMCSRRFTFLLTQPTWTTGRVKHLSSSTLCPISKRKLSLTRQCKCLQKSFVHK